VTRYRAPMSRDYEGFELDADPDGTGHYLVLWCRPCNQIIWEPLGVGDRLEAITDAADEHMCRPAAEGTLGRNFRP
jgi:hypothetical protein